MPSLLYTPSRYPKQNKTIIFLYSSLVDCSAWRPLRRENQARERDAADLSTPKSSARGASSLSINFGSLPISHAPREMRLPNL